MNKRTHDNHTTQGRQEDRQNDRRNTMSLYDYRQAQKLVHEDVPFYALIQAAMMKADSHNSARLNAAWPEIRREVEARYHEPGGLLDEELYKELYDT